MSDFQGIIDAAGAASTDEAKRKVLIAAQRASQKYLSDEKFASLFDEAQAIINEEAAEGVEMFFMCHGRKYDANLDEWCVMPVLFADWPPPENIGKHKTMIGVGATFADKFPDYMLVAVTHISEAWMVSRHQDAPQEDMDLAPSESPDRIEVAFAHAISFDRRTSYRASKMLRDKDEKFTGLETIMEQLYNPEKPLLPPEDNQDYLSNGIFEGYMMARAKNKEDKDATKE